MVRAGLKEVRRKTKAKREAREMAEVVAAAVVVVSLGGGHKNFLSLVAEKYCRCLSLNFRYRPRYVRRGGARASGDEGQATSGDDDHDHEGGDEVGHS